MSLASGLHLAERRGGGEMGDRIGRCSYEGGYRIMSETGYNKYARAELGERRKTYQFAKVAALEIFI
jgi:hypothetical protein